MNADPCLHPLSGVAARRREPRDSRDPGDPFGNPARHPLLNHVGVRAAGALPVGDGAIRVRLRQRRKRRPVLRPHRNLHGLHGAGTGTRPRVVIERHLQESRIDLDRILEAGVVAPRVLVARREQHGDSGSRTQSPPADPVLGLMLRRQVQGHPPGGGAQRRADADSGKSTGCARGDRSGQVKPEWGDPMDRARVRAKVPEQEVGGLVEVVGPELLCPDRARTIGRLISHPPAPVAAWLSYSQSAQPWHRAGRGTLSAAAWPAKFRFGQAGRPTGTLVNRIDRRGSGSA